jgi:hypothetical protein
LRHYWFYKVFTDQIGKKAFIRVFTAQMRASIVPKWILAITSIHRAQPHSDRAFTNAKRRRPSLVGPAPSLSELKLWISD